VKAHLITHHLLFVGFGLGDDHFYEIIHDVRRAISSQGDKSYMGTALSLYPDPLQDLAWRGKLRVLSMTRADMEWDDQSAGRQLEIFLDAMMAYATYEHQYLLAEKFGDGLSPDDHSLREDLLELAGKHDATNGGNVWPIFRTALEKFGLTSPSVEEELEGMHSISPSSPSSGTGLGGSDSTEEGPRDHPDLPSSRQINTELTREQH
jgi:hypothetical protein